MKDWHNAMRNMAAIMIGPVVFLAGGLVVVGPAMSADSRLSSAQYREAVNDADARYQAHLLQCNTMSGDERTPCRREARAARTATLAAAKAQRASGTDKSMETSTPSNPEKPSGLKASKTDIAPQLQRDSPPDIILPEKK
jgi:hypothetical protein